PISHPQQTAGNALATLRNTTTTWIALGRTTMMSPRQKRQPAPGSVVVITPNTTYSSDLLTPDEERDLLSKFWDTKSELVKALIQNFPRLRSHRPPKEPWPMAQFIRDYCDGDARRANVVRRVHDRYIHYKHRLASANIRLAAHVAKRF